MTIVTWIVGRLAAETHHFLFAPNLLPFVGIALAVWAFAWVAGVGAIWWAGLRLSSPSVWALAAPTGLAITASLWASVVSLGVSPTSPWLWAVPLAIAAIGWQCRRADAGLPRGSWSWRAHLPIAAVWVAAFAVLANLLGDNLVYPGYDSQSTAYFGWLLEREHAYPIVHPFPGPTRMMINYPPAFELIYVLLRQVLPWPLEMLQLGTGVAVSTLFSVAVAGLVLQMTGSPWWAVCGGVASLARGFTFQIIAGNTTEALAMVAMAAALGWVALGVTRWKVREAVLVGLCCSAAIFSNGKVFVLYAVTLVLAGFWWLASRAGERAAALVWLSTATAACALPLVPWAWRALSGLQLVGRLVQHPIVHPWQNVSRWNEPWLLALALAGAVAALAVGPLLPRLLTLHGLVCLALAQYWVVLWLWSPPWFQIIKVPFDDWLGADRLFTTRLMYPYTNEIGFTGYTIAVPVLVAFLGHVATGRARVVGERLSGPRAGRGLRTVCLAIGACLAVAAARSMHPPEPVGYQLLSPADYRVLKWVARTTPREGTFVLNPWHLSPAPEGNWAGVVADRPTVFFRNADVFTQWLDPPPEEETLKGGLSGAGGAGIARPDPIGGGDARVRPGAPVARAHECLRACGRVRAGRGRIRRRRAPRDDLRGEMTARISGTMGASSPRADAAWDEGEGSAAGSIRRALTGNRTRSYSGLLVDAWKSKRSRGPIP